jgi:hypothetical protein
MLKLFVRTILAPETVRTAWIVFSTLNNDYSAQDRPRVLKLVSLDPSGKKDSEHVFKIFLTCFNEIATQTSDHHKKSV